MTLSDLGNIGEFIGAFGVIGSLLYVGYQIRQNTLATNRANARASASDHARALHGALDKEVSDIVMRGLANLDDLTPHEQYRFDLAITVWLEAIEQAFADFEAKSYPEDLIHVHRIRVPGVLNTRGGTQWWAERRVWYSENFRGIVDELLANPPDGADSARIRMPHNQTTETGI